jgi:hypothetical protein
LWIEGAAWSAAFVNPRTPTQIAMEIYYNMGSLDYEFEIFSEYLAKV